MSENEKSDLTRFKALEEELKSKVQSKLPNALASIMDQKAHTIEKLDLSDDMGLSVRAVLGLLEGDTAGLLKFLCDAKSDRLPFELRKTLVSMLNGDSILQLRPEVAVRIKGLTVEKVNNKSKRLRKIVNAYILAGGLDRHKDGIEAARKSTGLGNSTVSATMNLERRDFYKKYRLETLESGSTLKQFLDIFRSRD